MNKAISRFNFVSSLYFCMYFVRHFVRVKLFNYKDLTPLLQILQKYPITSLRERVKKVMSKEGVYIEYSYIYMVENFCIFCKTPPKPFIYNNLPLTNFLTKSYKLTKLLK